MMRGMKLGHGCVTFTTIRFWSVPDDEGNEALFFPPGKTKDQKTRFWSVPDDEGNEAG